MIDPLLPTTPTKDSKSLLHQACHPKKKKKPKRAF